MSIAFKDMIIEGSAAPGGSYTPLTPNLTKHIKSTYLPALGKVLPEGPKGLKLLMTIMANTEGFYPGSRSFDNNNPGNIGNTDSGKNKFFPTLQEGIQHQVQHVKDIAAGKKKAYPLGKPVFLRPGHSDEIEKHKKNYMVTSGWYPGYRFIYTGQLDQYVKIYATLPMIHNSYLNQIIGYFKKNGLTITHESKIQDIIAMT